MESPSPPSPASISALLNRAHSAIARARTLSSRLQGADVITTDNSMVTPSIVTEQSGQSHPSNAAASSPQQEQQPGPTARECDAERGYQCDTSRCAEASAGSSEATHPPVAPPADTAAGPVTSIAQRLSLLQNQQQDTLRQLMHLRMEQLRLRQQQLKALQCMLQAEVAELGDHPLQELAAQQALRLLSVSLHDLHVLYTAMLLDRSIPATNAALALSHADTRAEEVSRIVRDLLQVLRDGRQQAAGSSPDELAGATEEELQALPLHVCTQGSVLCGQSCMICLSSFQANDTLRCLQCAHHCHSACLDEWLRIKASCPLCKLSMRAGLSQAAEAAS